MMELNRPLEPCLTDPLARLRAALVGRYTIERELGRGGMATVYLAHDLKHNRRVAIKALKPELAAILGPERFLREIEIAAGLSHPHIVPLLDSGDAGGLLYYVMPLVEGESLRQRLSRERQLPLKDALAIARDVAGALAYAHGRGVIHRDVKPENILVESGQAVVTDFGIARAVSAASGDKLTETGVTVGTPAYMSPEQCSGRNPIDGRSDLYSLGCVLYEMLAGEPPFTGPTSQAVIARHLSERPRSLRIVRPTVSPHTQRVVEKTLAKVAADRFASADEFLDALSQNTRMIGLIQSGRRRFWVASAVSVALLGVVLVMRREPFPRASSEVGVVIVPFDDAGGEDQRRPASHLLLGEALQWLPNVRTIDGSRLLAGNSTWRTVALSDLTRGARQLGGQYLIAGSLFRGHGGDEVSVELYATKDGERVARANQGAGDDRLDRAFGAVALQVAGPLIDRERLLTGPQRALLDATSSIVTFGRLIEGQRRFWNGDFAAAATILRAAIVADTACGLAYYRLSVAQTWQHDYAAGLATVGAGLARRSQLAPRAVTLLRALRQYELRDGDSAIVAFQNAVLEKRDDIDAWLGLGEALFHFGSATGHRPEDAEPAFEQVVALDSTFAPIYSHLVDVALYRGDASRARRYLARMRGSDPQRRAREAAVTLWFGSPSARAEVLLPLRTADRSTLSDLVSLLIRDAHDLPLVDTIASYLLGPDRTPADRQRGGQYRLVTLAAMNRWPEAVAAWNPAAQRSAFDAWVVHADLAGYPAAELSAPMFARARALLTRSQIPNFALSSSDETQQMFQALVHRAVLRGDAREVRDLLRRMETAPAPIDSSDPMPAALTRSLRARLALLARDTNRAAELLVGAVARPDEPYLTFYPLSSMAPERRLLADLLRAQGHTEQSERWLNSFSTSWAVGDVLYVPHPHP
jgi:tRNA A-37 threonylcarbamoyl transferase component Bud32